MQLSVIIPTLNEAERIAFAIDRAAALQPAEIIVADGQSTDDTVAIARQKGATFVVGPRSRGEQLNLGARHASGGVLLFLHADTWLEPQAAGQINSALSECNVQCGAFRQQIEAPGVLYRCLEMGNALRARRWGTPYGDQGIFVRRALFERLGGFPPVPLMEDVLLLRRLRRESRPVLLPGPLHVSARRWQKNGVVRQTLNNWLFLLAERIGVSPHTLAKRYALRMPTEITREPRAIPDSQASALITPVQNHTSKFVVKQKL